MRILFTADPEIAVPPLHYGGVQRLVDAILREVKTRGHEVGLVAHPDSSAPADYFLAFPGRESQNSLDSIKNTVALSRAVRQFKPDLIHSFSRLLYMIPHMMSALPKLMTYGRYPSERTVSAASRLAGKSLNFTACSSHIRETGMKGGGVWHTVHNFVELDLFTFQEKVSADAPLVFLSRLDRIKGAHTAIAAARASGRKLIIAGNKAESGPEAKYFASEIKPHLKEGIIEYIGPVDDAQKNELLGSARAMIVPIEWEEPFGIVFIEALACGTPIISCPRGAVCEIMEDGKHGFIVRDAEQAADAISKIDQIDRSNCRKRVEELFTCPVVVNRYERIYRDMLGEA